MCPLLLMAVCSYWVIKYLLGIVGVGRVFATRTLMKCCISACGQHSSGAESAEQAVQLRKQVSYLIKKFRYCISTIPVCVLQRFLTARSCSLSKLISDLLLLDAAMNSFQNKVFIILGYCGMHIGLEIFSSLMNIKWRSVVSFIYFSATINSSIYSKHQNIVSKICNVKKYLKPQRLLLMI